MDFFREIKVHLFKDVHFQLETFTQMAAGYKLNITVFKMEKLSMSLGLSIFDATFNYFLILIQFDMAFKKARV